MRKKESICLSWSAKYNNGYMIKKSQVAIFIILALVIVSMILVLYFLKFRVVESYIPKEIEPVYSYYKSCIENELSNGAFILGQRGGYIESEFSPGSEFMPFSSELNFLGMGVPYWYYISGNNVIREQVPSKEKMQEQLSNFVEEKVKECNFEEFEKSGFEISLGNPEVETKIDGSSISADVKQQLTINFGDTSWSSEIHSISINSELGNSYELAKKIYEDNKQTMFLEKYGIDILRLNAPVDGSEIGCSTKIWQVNKIRLDLIKALETNTPHFKIKGNYYYLSAPENKYFVHDIGENIDRNINFMFSKEWPVKIEIWPSEGEILKAEPVGLQEGLGILGFCYVPYHFVYDFYYPVLIQIYSNSEIFQFPIVVSIDKNQPRVSQGEPLPDVVPELCLHKISPTSVSVYNSDLIPINAHIDFKCFDTTCSIGETKEGKLNSDFPQCVNGYIIATAEDYETKKQLATTIDSSSHTLILDKQYPLTLEILKSGVTLSNDYSVITISKMDEFGDYKNPQTLSYPEQSGIKLTEGNYEIKVYLYSTSSINFPESKTEKCVDVPKTGLLGVFGAKEKKCFIMNIPEQVVSFAVSGGGKSIKFITEDELKSSSKLKINVPSFTIPKSPESLQINYNNVEISEIDVSLE